MLDLRKSLWIGVVIMLSAASLPHASAGPCEQSARKVRKSGRLEARASFWLAIAEDLNSCDCGPSDAFWEALETFHDDMDEVQAQYQARLDVCDLLGSDPYCPDLDCAFSANVTNEFMPLIPGRTLVYQGLTEEGDLEEIRVTTLDDTIEIAGITCRKVRDVVTIDGEIVEDTEDWFAQDAFGNVWYLGEIALNYEDGFLADLDGSWRTDLNGAKPGIVMPANPVVGDAYRAEFLIAEAEDIVEMLALDQTVVIDLGTYCGCLQTLDTTPLSPGEIEWKFYAPGIGMIQEIKPETGETFTLVEIIDE